MMVTVKGVMVLVFLCLYMSFYVQLPSNRQSRYSLLQFTCCVNMFKSIHTVTVVC